MGYCGFLCGEEVCGDDYCVLEEICGSCFIDCGVCSVCGDGMCFEFEGEHCFNCLDDCG